MVKGQIEYITCFAVTQSHFICIDTAIAHYITHEINAHTIYYWGLDVGWIQYFIQPMTSTTSVMSIYVRWCIYNFTCKSSATPFYNRIYRFGRTSFIVIRTDEW